MNTSIFLNKWMSRLMFSAAVVSLVMGFFKLFVYKNYDTSNYPTLASKNINAYVGGDAYNFITNGTHATAYFTLFGAFLISTILIEIAISYFEIHESSKVSE